MVPGQPRILRRDSDVIELPTLEEREPEMDMELEAREPEPTSEPEPIICGGKFNPCRAYKTAPGQLRIL
jgi:hypothetical protein